MLRSAPGRGRHFGRLAVAGMVRGAVSLRRYLIRAPRSGFDPRFYPRSGSVRAARSGLARARRNSFGLRVDRLGLTSEGR